MSATASPPAYLERVAYADTEKVAQIAAQRLSGPLSARATAELYAGYARECAGGCGHSVISREMHGELTKRAQRILYEQNIRVAHKHGACKLCVAKVRKQKEPVRPSREQQAEEYRQRITSLWEEVRGSGGSYKQLGDRLGVTSEAARLAVRKLGLPKQDNRVFVSRQFIEELEFLHSLGEGVYSIARALGVSPEGLVKKVDSLFWQKKTTVRFSSWNRAQEEAA